MTAKEEKELRNIGYSSVTELLFELYGCDDTLDLEYAIDCDDPD